MNYGKKIINLNRMIIFLAVLSVITVSALWFLSSAIIASATHPLSGYYLYVKHNSSHSSDLKTATGSATILLQTDVINDSDCGAWPLKKKCINNTDMNFLVQVSDNSGTEGNLYKKTVTGAPDIINLQVTTSDDSTKSKPNKLNVKFNGPNNICYGGGGDLCAGGWFFNESVSTPSCDADKIWNGATIQCHLVIHYAWSE